MTKARQERYDHVVVGAGLAGLVTLAKLSGSKLLVEATDNLGGRFSSGLHVMKSSEAQKSPFLKVVQALEPIKIRWDRVWVSADEVKWEDASWKGVYLKTWDHYFGSDLCQVEFDTEAVKAQLEPENLLRFSEPVVELAPGEGEGAWLLKTPQATITAGTVHWCAGLTAFQNAVGKHSSQKFLGENVLPSASDKDFRGGFAIDWIIPNEAYVGKTELCPEIVTGGLLGIPVKHNGVYLLMILHLSVQANELQVRSLTYAHEDVLRDPKESLSLQKALKRGLKMLFVDQNAVDLQTNSERMVVDQRLLGASSGLTWLLNPQPDIGLLFAGEESLVATSESSGQGLERVTESIL